MKRRTITAYVLDEIDRSVRRAKVGETKLMIWGNRSVHRQLAECMLHDIIDLVHAGKGLVARKPRHRVKGTRASLED